MLLAKDYVYCRTCETQDRAQKYNHFRGIEGAHLGVNESSSAGVKKWFTDLPWVRIAMDAGTHSIWISERLQKLGHEVIVANVRELRAMSYSDRVDAEKLARYARLDPKIMRPIAHRTVAQKEALTVIRAGTLIVRLRTAAVNAVRGPAKSLQFSP
jgi:transposase